METEAALPAPTPEPTDGKRLTPAEWEQVVILWESGSVTLQDLSDRFGISKPSLHAGLKKRNSVKGCRAKEFARATEDALKSDAQRQAEAVRGFRTKYQAFGDYIMQSAIIELQALRALPRASRSREDNSRIFTSIKYTAEVYALCRDQKFHLFDLYKESNPDEELPDIGVTEYTPEEIAAIREQTELPLMEEGDELLEAAKAALGEVTEEPTAV